MKVVRNMLIATVLLGLTAALSHAQTQIYIAQNAAGANSGADCSNAHAASWFNSSANWGSAAGQVGPGDTVHVCGTITGSAGGTVLAFQGSGTSGSPITLYFESGAVVQAPYCKSANGGSAGGCISALGRSYVTVDGNAKSGTVQNSLNGASGATCPGGSCSQRATSTLLDLQNCNNCTVQNLTIGPTYIEIQNASSENSTNEVAIQMYGSNQVLANNNIPDCGWCVNFAWANGNTNYQAYGNSFSNFGHAFALFGPSGAVCGPPCSIIHDNHIGPAGTNWDAAGCPNHKDGIHYYGGTRHDGAYVYNNWFGGDWGMCPTGFIYHDGSPLANIKDNYTWNNVFQVVNTSFVNTNGWVYGSNGAGRVVVFLNNTFVGSGAVDNTNAFQFWASSTFTFEGNVVVGVGNPIGTHTGTKTLIDYNVYDGLCNLGNCYQWNSGSYSGSFNSWKSACGCDTHSVQSSSPGVNSDGTLQSTSVAISFEPNLSTSATGSLASLAYDTSAGGTRTPVARPIGTNAWDAGAFDPAGSVAVNPPSGLVATVN